MMTTKIQFKRATSSEWSNLNPVLAQGEPGIELSDTGYVLGLKIGDGSSTWLELSYIGTSPDNTDYSVKCHMLFNETPLTGENNAYLKDDTGNFNFTRIKYYDSTDVINSSLSQNGGYCIRTSPKIWVKAEVHDSLININPAQNYMFTISAYVNSSQDNWSFYEFNGHTYCVIWGPQDSTSEEFKNTYIKMACLDNHPCSVHSAEELEFLRSKLIAHGITVYGNTFIALGGIPSNDYSAIVWIDGSLTDYDDFASGGSSEFFLALTQNQNLHMQGYAPLSQPKVFEWDYILRRNCFLALGEELFFRYEDSKLKLEIPAWNFNIAGQNNLNTDTWSQIILKINSGKISAYANGVQEISVDIPQDAETIKPDFISLGGFTGYIDEFIYQHSV